jgi:hypothetical protein
LPVTGSAVEFGCKGESVRRELNVLALIKGNERYVYVYDDTSRDDLIDTFRAQAATPHLSFSWFDAAVLTEKAREQAQIQQQEMPPARVRMGMTNEER